MSGNKKEKVIHVDKLIVHAKDVKIIHDRKEDDFPRRDPWGFFRSRPRNYEVFEKESKTQELHSDSNKD